MLNTKFSMRAGALWGALTLALAGCATNGAGITDAGRPDDVVAFPDAAAAWVQGGTFPNLANLRQVARGVTKDQLYALLGRPHFREGLFGVREWDYVFNFRTASDGVVICQYKVRFDSDARGRSFHWAPADCADRLAETSPASPAAMVTVPPLAQTAAIDTPAGPRRAWASSDVLFASGRSRLAGLLPGGTRELTRLLDELQAGGRIDRLEVVGHADRLEATAHPQRLAEARARAVRRFLTTHGLPPARIDARGDAPVAPTGECPNKKRSAALIACLAPNRHVEILAWMTDAAP